MRCRLVSRLTVAVLICASLGACATSGPQGSETARAAAQPLAKPVRAVTDFSDALRCMDRLFARHGVRDVLVTAPGLPDQTGRVAAGTKDMLISAVSTMSATSRALRFVAYGSDIADILDLQNAHAARPSFEVPDFFVRGGITQLDESVLKSQGGVNVTLPLANFGVNADQVVSLVSLDLNMGRVRDLQILSGIGATNALAVVRRGADAKGSSEMGGLITKAGISFEISFARSEGMHQAVRTLIELGAIETFGKLARVPYWECLGIDSAHGSVAEVRRTWDAGQNEIADARALANEARPPAEPQTTPAAATTTSTAPMPAARRPYLAEIVARQLGLALDPTDAVALELQLRRLLEDGGPGDQRTWRSDTGNSGLMAYADVSRSSEGRSCTSVDHRHRIEGDLYAGSMVLCTGRGGVWELASGRARRLPEPQAAPPASAPRVNEPRARDVTRETEGSPEQRRTGNIRPVTE